MSTVQPASGESADHQPIPIESLKIDGNHNYTPDQILAVAGLKIGQRVMKNDFEGARDRLVATGAFDNVGYRYAPAADAKGYDVLFQVTEMEHLYPLRFDDLPASDAQLRAWLKDNDPLFDGKTGAKIPGTKPELDRYVKLISEFLARQEYHEPVIGKLVSIAPSELVIVFRPAAPPPSVAYVKFNNTGDISAATLQKQIYSVAVGTVYTEQQFRTLLDSSIRPLYDAIGRIRASFPKIRTETATDVKGIVVTVDVDQGPVFKLAKVNFTGAPAPQEPYDRIAKLKTDQTVNFDEVKAAQQRIEDSFRRTGYLNVKSEVKRDVHDADKTVDVRFEIVPGPQFSFGQLTLIGLDLYSEPVIRKMWGLQTGKPFNPSYPAKFLDSVKEQGLFDNLKSTRAENKVNAENHIVDVTLYFNK